MTLLNFCLCLIYKDYYFLESASLLCVYVTVSMCLVLAYVCMSINMQIFVNVKRYLYSN